MINLVNICLQHFLSFLNCVKSKEFAGAKTSLHNCLDRASIPLDKTTPPATAPNTLNNEKKEFRYASLSLAAMHASFGHL